MYFQLRFESASILLILLHPHSPPPPSPPSSTVFRYKGKISKSMCFPLVCSRLYSACIRLYRLGCRSPRVFVLRVYSFVFRLYSFVPPGMSFPLGFCTPSVLVCTRLYSVCIRFVPPGMLFPISICIPFVFVCTLTPFGEYNTIRGREEYKSTKTCKCAPSIVLGAR